MKLKKYDSLIYHITNQIIYKDNNKNNKILFFLPKIHLMIMN